MEFFLGLVYVVIEFCDGDIVVAQHSLSTGAVSPLSVHFRKAMVVLDE